MKTIPKALVGTAVAGAMAMAGAAPANAQIFGDGYDDDDGISVGEVIAGAVILGGIAAIAGSIGDDDRYDDRYYRDGRYGYYNGNPRQAVSQCVNTIQGELRRRGYRYADVTQIRDVDDTDDGWDVDGRLVVQGGRYDRYGDYGRYGYYDRDDDDWDDRRRYSRGADEGSFSCRVERGRIRDIDIDGIRGL